MSDKKQDISLCSCEFENLKCINWVVRFDKPDVFILFLFSTDGCKIFDESGETEIGVVTSGCPSPTLKQNISMGYVKPEFSSVGNKVIFDIRKKKIPGQVAKMPFVPTNYFVVKKK